MIARARAAERPRDARRCSQVAGLTTAASASVSSARSVAPRRASSPAKSAATIEVSAQAEQEWIDHCLVSARQVGDFFENCTPGYYNNEGKPGERSAQDGFYGGGSPAFFTLLDAWRAKGDLPGLVVTLDRV